MRNETGRLFAGILIIGLGLLFLLGSLDQVDVGQFIGDYWPLFLIFVGIWHMVSSNFRNLGGGLILIAIGGFFLLANLDLLPYSAWRLLWPAAIIAVGLWVIFRPRFRGVPGETPKVTQDDLGAFVMFWGSDHIVKSQAFRGGKATAMFGGIDIDLRDAKLAGGEATLDLTAMFGGIEVKAPLDWNVVVDSHALLGGVDNKHRGKAGGESTATLYVKATALFGGIDIKD